MMLLTLMASMMIVSSLGEPCTEEQIAAEKACADKVFGSPEGFWNATKGETQEDLEADCDQWRQLSECGLPDCDDVGVRNEMKYALLYCNFTHFPNLELCNRQLNESIFFEIEPACQEKAFKYFEESDLPAYPSGYGEIQPRKTFCPFASCAAEFLATKCGPQVLELVETVDEADCKSDPVTE